MSAWIIHLKNLYEELGIKIRPSTSLWIDPTTYGSRKERSSKIGLENYLQILVMDWSIDCIHTGTYI
jgi:hypothetical protein